MFDQLFVGPLFSFIL